MVHPRIDQVVAYLAVQGWEVTGHWRGADVWTWREFDVLIPSGEDAADAARRLRDVLVCVADSEKRSPHAVAREMVSPESDLVSYRVALPEFAVIPLSTGLNVVKAVRSLLVACARVVVDDLPGVEVRAVDRLIERTSLATAAEGFGLDLSVPVHDEAVPRFGRAITTRLLHASAAALVSDEKVPIGAEDGVLRALAELAGDGRGVPFDLGLRWATSLPSAEDNTTLHFPDSFTSRVRARQESSVAVARGVVQGRVTRLAHDGTRRVITVRGALALDGRSTGKERSVRVRIEDQQTYLAAVEAHMAERVVRAQGWAESTGTKHTIVVEPGGFTVVDRERG